MSFKNLDNIDNKITLGCDTLNCKNGVDIGVNNVNTLITPTGIFFGDPIASARYLVATGNFDLNFKQNDGTGVYNDRIRFVSSGGLDIQAGGLLVGGNQVISSTRLVRPVMSGVAGVSNVEVDGNGDLTITPSLLKYKDNVKPLREVLDHKKLYDLDVKQFKWKEDQGGFDDIGMIAEQFSKLFPQKYLSRYDEDGKLQGIHYHKLCLLLIECVKDLKKEIDELKK